MKGRLLSLLFLNLVDRLGLLDRTNVVFLRQINDQLVLSLDHVAIVLDFELGLSETFSKITTLLLSSLVQHLIFLCELLDLCLLDFRQTAKFLDLILRSLGLSLVVAHHAHEAIDGVVARLL